MSMDEPEREVLAGVGLDRPLPPPPGRPAAAQGAPGPLPGGGPPPGGNGALPGPPAVPAAALKLVKKAQKKAAKEARKVRCTLLNLERMVRAGHTLPQSMHAHPLDQMQDRLSLLWLHLFGRPRLKNRALCLFSS